MLSSAAFPASHIPRTTSVRSACQSVPPVAFRRLPGVVLLVDDQAVLEGSPTVQETLEHCRRCEESDRQQIQLLQELVLEARGH